MLVSAVQESESVHNPILSVTVGQPYVPYTINAMAICICHIHIYLYAKQ